MKKSALFLILFCAMPLTTHNINGQEKIVLSAHIVDGIFIKADDMQLMYTFGAKIHILLFGTKTSEGTTVGNYAFNNKLYTIRDLVEIEQGNLLPIRTLQNILEEALTDFLVISNECLNAACTAKSRFTPLIREYCEKRNKHNSHLLTWAQIKEGEEDKSFKKDIANFKVFYDFCIDLIQFFEDIVNSCPKACKQFKQRIEKLTLIKELLTNSVNSAPKTKKEFIGYLMKDHYIDKVNIIDLTTQKIQELWHEFINYDKTN